MKSPLTQSTPVILIADDERVTRMLLRHILSQDGYEIIETENGAECLQACEELKPDIVLLDAMMPIMDGFTCCAELQKLPRSHPIPVLMITALEDPPSVAKAFNAGAIDFITKPIQTAILQQRLRRILQASWAEQSLRASESKYRTVVNSLKEVIFQITPQGEITFLNQAWPILTGFTLQESQGNLFPNYLHPNEQSSYHQEISKILEQKAPNIRYESRLQQKNGGFSDIEIYADAVYNSDQKIIAISGTINDISDRKQRERNLKADFATTHVLAKAQSISETMPEILSALCHTLGWDFARRWMVNPQENSLSLIETWTPPLEKGKTSYSYQCFLDDHDQQNIHCGEGFLGQIWQTQHCLWLSDLPQNLLFSRRDLALKAGLKTALGVPILAGEECLGVMIFYSQEVVSIDDDLLQVMETIGTEIGQFIKRKQAEEELQLLGKLLALRYQAYAVVDGNLNILKVSSGLEQFTEYPQALQEGVDIHHAFPELFGQEEILEEILQGIRPNYELNGIAKTLNESTRYINIYVVGNQTEDTLQESLFIFLEEVTEQMALKQALVQKENETSLLAGKLSTAENYIAKVITSMADCLLVTDEMGNIRTINKAGQLLFGYQDKEVINQSIRLLLGEKFMEIYYPKILSGHYFKDLELICENKTGRKFPVAFSCSQIQIDIQEKGIVYVIRDITERKQAEYALKQQNQLMQSELNQAANYVRSLLPAPLRGSVSIDQKFMPSSQLGGDAFDYYWLDDDSLILYLLDVAGHGVRPALLSVSVMSLLRSQSLYNTDFNQPKTVLGELNRVFQMSDNGDDYFTIWYGVYNRITRQLTYACAGHPPAILISQEDVLQVKKLDSLSIPLGMLSDIEFDQETHFIPPQSTLYLYSDGVYEIPQADGQIWGRDAFIEQLTQHHHTQKNCLDQLLQDIEEINQSKNFNDDFSLLRISFTD